MRPCRDLDGYLARGLAPSRASAFEEHLAGCAECRGAVASWDDVVRTVNRSARADAASRQVTAEDRLRLVSRARREEGLGRAPSRRRTRVALLAAASMVLVLGAVVIWRVGFGAATENESAGAEAKAGKILEATGETWLAIHVGPARLAQAPGSEVRLLSDDPTETRLRLVHGRIALEAQSLIDGAQLIVEAGRLEVRVKGTVFAVARDRDRIRVETVEGEVAVARADGSSWRVVAGRQLVEDSAGGVFVDELPDEARSQIVRMLSASCEPEREPTNPLEVVEATDVAVEPSAPPDRAGDETHVGNGLNGSMPAQDGILFDRLQVWRELVASGRFVEAEGELTRYLDTHPDDTAAWSLLADCRRKSGRWNDAVAAYLELIDRASGSEAGLARYKAGVILQDRLGDHLAAERLFRAYLERSGSGALVPDAMVRRARSLAALGEEQSAARLLEQVIQAHEGSFAADAARRMLGNLRDVGEGTAAVEQPSK
jgi:ferric-dicitrate binding protein FerR (iron transport regulator)/TolA-binding protein